MPSTVCVYASATNLVSLRSRLWPVSLKSFNQNSQQLRRPDVFLLTALLSNEQKLPDINFFYFFL